MANTEFKLGDTVRVYPKKSDMIGMVIKLARPRPFPAPGNVRAWVTVEWENGHIGRCEDRGLERLARDEREVEALLRRLGIVHFERKFGKNDTRRGTRTVTRKKRRSGRFQP